jgi:hypothetical protein
MNYLFRCIDEFQSVGQEVNEEAGNREPENVESEDGAGCIGDSGEGGFGNEESREVGFDNEGRREEGSGYRGFVEGGSDYVGSGEGGSGYGGFGEGGSGNEEGNNGGRDDIEAGDGEANNEDAGDGGDDGEAGSGGAVDGGRADEGVEMEAAREDDDQAALGAWKAVRDRNLVLGTFKGLLANDDTIFGVDIKEVVEQLRGDLSEIVIRFVFSYFLLIDILE